MPVGYLITTVVVALCVGFALASPHPRQSRPWRLSFWFAWFVNELPFATFFWLAATTALAASQGDLATPGGAVGAVLALFTTMGLVVVVVRATRARRTLHGALVEGLGADAAVVRAGARPAAISRAPRP